MEVIFWMMMMYDVLARCWSPHEASPFVPDSQFGVALWTLQENDGMKAGADSHSADIFLHLLL